MKEYTTIHNSRTNPNSRGYCYKLKLAVDAERLDEPIGERLRIGISWSSSHFKGEEVVVVGGGFVGIGVASGCGDEGLQEGLSPWISSDAQCVDLHALRGHLCRRLEGSSRLVVDAIADDVHYRQDATTHAR